MLDQCEQPHWAEYCLNAGVFVFGEDSVPFPYRLYVLRLSTLDNSSYFLVENQSS